MCNTFAITACHVSPFLPVKPSQTLLLSLLMLPLPGLAAGLGELTVHSQLGEPLRAEIPVSASASETLDSNCFRLAPIHDAELPVIPHARLLLEKRRDGLLLHIVGDAVLKEPLAMLRVRANCGTELQRDYFVMPQLPASQIADDSAGGTPTAAVRRNDAASPAAKRQRAAGSGKKTRHAASGAPSPLQRLAEENQRQVDRLVVSDQLASLPGDSVAAATEDRLLRMETSLARLNDSLQALDQAIELQSEAQNARHELQLAMALTDPPAAGPVGAMASEQLPKAETPFWRQWLELIFGTLIGGALSALLLQRIGRLIPGYQDR